MGARWSRLCTRRPAQNSSDRKASEKGRTVGELATRRAHLEPERDAEAEHALVDVPLPTLDHVLER